MSAAAVTFENAYFIISMDSSVAYVDLGFPGGHKLENGQKQQGTISGKSSKAVVHYKDENPPPATFGCTKSVTYADGADVYIRLGGPNDNIVRAEDRDLVQAFWRLGV
ncbi:hypothetical protein O9K51_05906 [Purpureocillium lavendulum]|uniref:Uncharacterized protein n=1 Tax=Purpureocillium lavendulum TaxID=1247861 RepID=A0AB34FS53_9HYPO|nr:hypothetical protein O9K51_05906 [Purpureocillium lavendulum]